MPSAAFVLSGGGGAVPTPIRATCPACDTDIAVPSTDVKLVMCSCSHVWTYRCPACQTWVVRPADGHVISVLRSVGVVPLLVKDVEPSPRPVGPPLDADDEIRMGLELEALPNGGPS